MTIIRVPFPVKLRPGQGSAGWRVHRNPLFHLYFAWQLRRAARAAGARDRSTRRARRAGGRLAGGREPRTTGARHDSRRGIALPVGHCTPDRAWQDLRLPDLEPVRGRASRSISSIIGRGSSGGGGRGSGAARAGVARSEEPPGRALRESRCHRGEPWSPALFDPSVCCRLAARRRAQPAARDIVRTPPADALDVRSALESGPVHSCCMRGSGPSGRARDVSWSIRSTESGRWRRACASRFAGKGEMRVPAAPDLHRRRTRARRTCSRSTRRRTWWSFRPSGRSHSVASSSRPCGWDGRSWRPGLEAPRRPSRTA